MKVENYLITHPYVFQTKYVYSVSSDLILARARKKRTRSKINAMSVMAAAAPEMQEEKQLMENSRTCARRPKIAEMPARPKPITWRKRAYVIHFVTTSGISMVCPRTSVCVPSSLLGSRIR